jgi:hypothetical protein
VGELLFFGAVVSVLGSDVAAVVATSCCAPVEAELFRPIKIDAIDEGTLAKVNAGSGSDDPADCDSRFTYQHF